MPIRMNYLVRELWILFSVYYRHAFRLLHDEFRANGILLHLIRNISLI